MKDRSSSFVRESGFGGATTKPRTTTTFPADEIQKMTDARNWSPLGAIAPHRKENDASPQEVCEPEARNS